MLINQLIELNERTFHNGEIKRAVFHNKIQQEEKARKKLDEIKCKLIFNIKKRSVPVYERVNFVKVNHNI